MSVQRQFYSFFQKMCLYYDLPLPTAAYLPFLLSITRRIQYPSRNMEKEKVEGETAGVGRRKKREKKEKG